MGRPHGGSWPPSGAAWPPSPTASGSATRGWRCPTPTSTPPASRRASPSDRPPLPPRCHRRPHHGMSPTLQDVPKLLGPSLPFPRLHVPNLQVRPQHPQDVPDVPRCPQPSLDHPQAPRGVPNFLTLPSPPVLSQSDPALPQFPSTRMSPVSPVPAPWWEGGTWGINVAPLPPLHG